MTKIKICGFTKVEEIAYIESLPVDFMGMVLFFPKSKRNISIEQAKKIIEAAPEEIHKVAVVVSPTLEQVREIERAGFDFIQIHGTMAEDLWENIHLPVIRAYNGETGAVEENDQIFAYLLDAASPGSGKVWDWKAVSSFDAKGKNIFLAGGLTPENVAEAIQTVHPYGVDASSGVERTEGGKDQEKISKFVKEVCKSRS